MISIVISLFTEINQSTHAFAYIRVNCVDVLGQLGKLEERLETHDILFDEVKGKTNYKMAYFP